MRRFNFAYGDLCNELLTLLTLQIAHAIGARKERWHKSNPTWRFVGTANTAGVNGDEFPSDHAYGCLRCPVKIDLNSGAAQWYRKVSVIKEHIRKE
jgi:hypothetical protein